jgi:hypothetical protein
MPDRPDDAPEADVAEQRETPDGVPDDATEPTRLGIRPSTEASEADLHEQAQLVDEVQAVVAVPAPPDVDPADWADQHVVELDPDDER